MVKIILTRHGHVEGIEPKRFRGRAELSLTPLGDAQARALAACVAARWRPAAIYTSPMGRCVATAEKIGAACKLDVKRLDGLNDLDYGAWQGQSHEDVRAALVDTYNDWMMRPHLVRFPNGESLQDLVARTADVLRTVIATHRDAATTIVLVGHDSVNRAILLQMLDQPLSAYWRLAQSPCALNEIDIVAGKVTVERINETAHLADVTAEL